MEKVLHYRDLKVWQKAMDLTQAVYRYTQPFPQTELYGLAAQLRRAAVSVPSNIAEGSARSTRDFLRFISMATGSLAEIETQVLLSHGLGFAADRETQALIAMSDEIGKMLRGLAKRLQERAANQCGESSVLPFESESLATNH